MTENSGVPHMIRTRVLDLSRADDDTYVFRTSLRDISHGGDYEAGGDTQPVHDFSIRGRVDRADLKILELKLEAATHPYPACPKILGVAQKLVGASLKKGWKKTVLKHLGGTLGCTHVTTLLLGLSELVTLFIFLEVNAKLTFGPVTKSEGRWMKTCVDVAGTLDDACHVLTVDGEVLSKARNL